MAITNAVNRSSLIGSSATEHSKRTQRQAVIGDDLDVDMADTANSATPSLERCRG